MLRKYKIDWISSLDPNNTEKLNSLAEKMSQFYSNNLSYYSNISESENYWKEDSQLIHRHLIKQASVSSNILEIGCGESSILKFNPKFSEKYTGIDFSSEILDRNKQRFPKANFQVIKNPGHYNFESKSFDLVFSVFVIEHTVYPHKFLEECMRLVSDQGKIAILAPNYIDNKFMISQQVASTLKDGRKLLSEGKIIDAIRSAYYNRILIPKTCKKLQSKIPGFYININPVCFSIDEFKPDVDAVYVVSQREIDLYMKNHGFFPEKLHADIEAFKIKNRLFYQIYKRNQ
ncbi:class I SAM-dependent methyltransferase [Algoriphagus sp.]|uniref:class I SAM-dependent methyltransferase n=1 Tax=Algoriphagus sp. TaxID=1872435 RepID=UPI0039196662